MVKKWLSTNDKQLLMGRVFLQLKLGLVQGGKRLKPFFLAGAENYRRFSLYLLLGKKQGCCGNIDRSLDSNYEGASL